MVAVHARAAQHVPPALRRRTLALVVDALGLNYATFRGRVPLPLDLVYRSEARRMARFETGLLREFGAVAVVSPTDARHLRAHAPEPDRVVLLPYAVDLAYFTPRSLPVPAGRPVFVFTGRLGYLPNVDAASRLLADVWPLLRRRWLSQLQSRTLSRQKVRRRPRLTSRRCSRIRASTARWCV